MAVAAPGDAEEKSKETKSAFAPPPTRLVVDRFQGPAALDVRTGAIQGLEREDSVDLLSLRLLEKNRAALDGSPEGYAEVGTKLQLRALLRGKVQKIDAGYRVTVNVIDGPSGRSLSGLQFQALTIAELMKALRTELWPMLEALFDETSKPTEPEVEPPVEAPPPEQAEAEKQEPPPEQVEAEKQEPPPEQVEAENQGPPPEQVEAEKREPPPKEEAERKKPMDAAPVRVNAPRARCPWLELEAGGGVGFRWFNYRQEQRGALRAYVPRGAPLVRAGASIHPFSRRCPLESGLGIALAHEQLVGAKSRLAERELGTLAFASSADFVFDIPLSFLTLRPRAGWAWRYFALAEDFVPDASYHLARPGLDLGLKLRWFVAELGGSYRFVLDAGQLEASDWFPEATGFGYDVRARLGVAPLRWLDVLLDGSFELYAFELNASRSGAYPHGVAGAVRERHAAATLVLGFHLPERRAAR